MNNPRLASRYAKSLLDLAVEQNSLEATLKDVQLLDAYSTQSADFRNMLRSPVIKADKKQAILNAIIGDKMQPLAKGFVALLVTKAREAVLPEIAQSFLAQYKEKMKIRTVVLTTAAPASDALKDAIRAKVAAGMPGQTVEMETKVNPELIGGFMLEMGDKIIDASVRRDLAEIKSQFTQNIYISQLN